MNAELSLNHFQQNVLLKVYCTFGIGGPATYFTEVRSIAEMQSALKICHAHSLPFCILGKGSNCLFSDRGFNGVIILNKIDFHQEIHPGSFYVGAGYSFSLLGTQTARNGWTGLEFASGIPATVGGAIFMNAGANGTETCETLVSVDFVTSTGELKTFLKKDLQFSYRSSSFHELSGAIVGATFQLNACSFARQKQLDIIRYRQATQPYGQKSAGCVFRNPSQKYAGALIEQCQLKGIALGGAAISTLHGNFIVNTGTASAKDVLSLISHIQNQVAIRTGITLESEVRVIPHHFTEVI
ncbi:MAG: UDP-N-acetylmuramate dehydrogenase [Parachlamydiaceae bacterium]